MSPSLRCTGLILLASLAPLPVRSQNFVENFSTTTYRDAAATSAWWDTATGTLRLPLRQISYVGDFPTAGAARDVFVDGDRAYVADGTSGLRIVDVGNPASPVGIGGYNPGGDAWGVEVDGDWCYLTVANRFHVVGVANPVVPIPMDSYTASTNVYGLAVSRPYAYVANGTAGLLILDVGDPTNVSAVGSLDTPGSAIAVAVAGDLAFVADRGGGLRIVNVQNPASPTAVGSYDTSGDTWGIAVDGDRAYVGDAAVGVHVLDVTNPYFPVLLGTCDTPGSARGIEPAGDWIYVADYSAVQAIDVSVPTDPTLVRTYDTPGIASNVALAGEHAFVADGAAGGLQILGVCDRLGVLPVGSSGGHTGGYCAVPQGHHLYVGKGSGGLEIYDISDPWSPVLAGAVPAVSCLDFDVDGDLGYAVGYEGLTVFSLQNPVVPVILGSDDYGPVPFTVAADGDFVYLGDDSQNLEIYSVADPSHPVYVGHCNLELLDEAPYDVAVAGSYAYVACGYADLKIVNIAFPSSPFLVAEADVGYWDQATGVAVTGDLALVAANSLWVFDISNPTAPVPLAELPVPGTATSVGVTGPFAIVAGCASTSVVDLSNPASPVVVAQTGVGGCDDVRPHGDFVFVDGTPIKAFERELDTHRNRGQSITVATTAQDISHVRIDLTMEGTLWVYPDISVSADNGVHWQEIFPAYWETLQYPGRKLRWRLDLNHYRGAPRCTELRFFWSSASDADLPGDGSLTEAAILPVTPNPSSSRRTIRFALPQRESVVLDVFDVVGRRVATLAEGEFDAGVTAIPWDGRSDDGGRVPAGTYFLRLRAGGRETARKLVLWP